MLELEYQSRPESKTMFWTGRVISGLVVLMMLFSGVMKLLKPPDVVSEFGRLGVPERYALGIGILEIACAIVYAIPRTAVLGAILLTGYLGGAILTHVRVDPPVKWIPPVIGGVLVWLGLFLRDRWVRELIPLRRMPAR